MSQYDPIDWPALREAAVEAASHAYAPYSLLRVGAAGLTDESKIVTGCNVENASYGLGLCSECGLVSDLYRSGGTRLLAISVVGEQGNFLWPCGRCRQLLYEVGGPDLLLDSDEGPLRLAALLPNAFGPEHLPSDR
jgi:cytidine deaminase